MTVNCFEFEVPLAFTTVRLTVPLPSDGTWAFTCVSFHAVTVASVEPK